MKNMILLIALVISTAACSEKVNMPPELDMDTDWSSELISENDMAKNGCVFVASTAQLKCEEHVNPYKIYAQRVSLYRYNNAARDFQYPQSQLTPTGKFINLTTVKMLGAKRISVYLLIRMPDGKKNTELFSSFTKIPGTDLVVVTLRMLLENLLQTDVVVDIGHQGSVTIDAEKVSIKKIQKFISAIENHRKRIEDSKETNAEALDDAVKLTEAVLSAATHL